jgi:RimJ/RimL family protein N-acetyltransferase
MPIQYPLLTSRLRLEPFQPTDGDALYVMERNPEVKQYAGGVTTRAQSDKLLQRFIASVRDTGFGPVAIKLRATGEIVGLCGFYGTEPAGEAEIFYGLARHAWGHGYATEAGQVLIAAGINQTGLTRIIAPVNPENVRSIRVLEKIGMTFSHVTTTDAMYGVAHVYCLESEKFGR